MLNDKIDGLETFKTEMTVKMDNISEDINDTMVSEEKFSNLEKDYSDLAKSISDVKNDLMAEIDEIRPYVGVIYKMHDSVIGTLFSTSNYAMGDIEGLKSPKWADLQEIATNIKTGKKYTAEQLVERPLLIPYI